MHQDAVIQWTRNNEMLFPLRTLNELREEPVTRESHQPYTTLSSQLVPI